MNKNDPTGNDALCGDDGSACKGPGAPGEAAASVRAVQQEAKNTRDGVVTGLTFLAGGGVAKVASGAMKTPLGKEIIGEAAETAFDAAVDFFVTPDGDAIPGDPGQLNENLDKLDDQSTKPDTSRKFVGTDPNGDPVRVRVEKAHPSDPNFKGTPDPLHTTDHLHVDKRKKGKTGSWSSKFKIKFKWPFK